MADRRFSPPAAIAMAGGAVAAAAWYGSKDSPTPQQPEIRNWYKGLSKPPFNPPDFAFGMGWSVIQTGLAAGGYRLMRSPGSPARDAALVLWGANQAAIAGWSAIFFRHRSPGWGAIASGTMIATAIAYTGLAAKVDRKAAASGLPLVGWLCFATLLAEEVWRRNRERKVIEDKG